MFFFGNPEDAAELLRKAVIEDKSLPHVDWGPMDEMDLKTLRIAYVATRMMCSEASRQQAPEDVQRILWGYHDELFEELMKYCPTFRGRYAKGLFRFPMAPSSERDATYNEIFDRISKDPQYSIDLTSSYEPPSAF